MRRSKRRARLQYFIRLARRSAKKVEMAERGHVTADGEPYLASVAQPDAGIIRRFFKVFDFLNSTLTHSQLRNAMGASILEIAARRALILAYPTRARDFEHAWLSVLRQSDCIQRAQASCRDASCRAWSTRRSTRYPNGAVLSDLSDDPSIVEPIELATDAALGEHGSQ